MRGFCNGFARRCAQVVALGLFLGTGGVAAAEEEAGPNRGRVSVSIGSDRCVTSSVIPIVKCRGPCRFESASNTDRAIAGVNSFDARPYRPPLTRTSAR